MKKTEDMRKKKRISGYAKSVRKGKCMASGERREGFPWKGLGQGGV